MILKSSAETSGTFFEIYTEKFFMHLLNLLYLHNLRENKKQNKSSAEIHQ